MASVMSQEELEMNADEDSFVILGTSPTPSLQALESNKTCGSDDQGDSSNTKEIGTVNISGTNSSSNATHDQILKSAFTDSANSKSSLVDLCAEMAGSHFQSPLQVANGQNSLIGSKSLENGISNSFKSLERSTVSKSKPNSLPFEQDSLATSFILGDINAGVLKNALYSQFPSLCSMEGSQKEFDDDKAKPFDASELQKLMYEYAELKTTLAKVNVTISLFYKQTQEHKENSERLEKEYNEKLESCVKQIATLRNENVTLKRNLDSQIEKMQIYNNIREEEEKQLVQLISEKTAKIQNMQVQIENLEQQQLASFEYIPKSNQDSKESPDYIDRLEHQRVVKELERKISELLAENMEVKEMQVQYFDEINCLKVNLTAAEELIKQSHADIHLLKAKDLEKAEILTNFQSQRDAMKEEIALLRQQVEIYSKDFEMERNARQEMAGEKEQLLQDLRALQRRNQELIEETKKNLDIVPQRCQITDAAVLPDISTKSKASPNKTAQQEETMPSEEASPSAPRCPLCFHTFPSFIELQDHVNTCLDNN